MRLQKEKLLNNRIIWKANAAIKSSLIVGKYKAWKLYYSMKAPKEKRFSKLINSSRPNVIYVGTDEKQDKSGFFQALTSNCNTVIPFTKEDGSWGQYDSDVENCAERNLKLLEKLVSSLEEKIDCVIMQSWGFSFDSEELNLLKRKYDFKIINIDMDSSVLTC